MAGGVLAISMTDDQLQRQAIRNYVLYWAVNNLQRRDFGTLEDRAAFAKEIMNQLLHEATRDDARLQRSCRSPE
eukprot:9154925-Pyramimonas_sp.AAC.1